MKKDLCEIVVVLDRSGSMESIKNDMIGGFNTFIAEQKKLPGECLVTLTQFDTEYDIVYSGKPLKDVPGLELVPRGSTALLDAVGRTINDVGARLKATAEDQRPERVLFVIVTDGQENVSHEFTITAINQMVTHQRDKYKWEFVYLGANQDSFAEAQKLGIHIAQNFKADAMGVAVAASNLHVGTRSYRGGGGYKTP
jgi:Mg-chelatase subunit ChlD